MPRQREPAPADGPPGAPATDAEDGGAAAGTATGTGDESRDTGGRDAEDRAVGPADIELVERMRQGTRRRTTSCTGATGTRCAGTPVPAAGTPTRPTI